LRLTEEEHAALREWAHGSRRSLQREIIFRLFSELSERGEEHSEPSHQERESRVPDRTPGEAHGANVLSRPSPRSESSDLHFKPDFGKKL
jgi:hypothetical protein